MNPKEKKLQNIFLFLQKSSNWTLCIIGTVIFTILLWYAMRFTQYIQPGMPEVPIDTADSLIKNAGFLALAMGVMQGFTMLEKRITEKTKARISIIFLLFTCIWVFLVGMWWVCSTERMPEGDQAAIFNSATSFVGGNFEALELNGYCRIYPQQLGMTIFLEGFYKLVGVHNYFAYEILCVVLAVGIVGIGYLFIQECETARSLCWMYCSLMAFCVPLIFYTPWLYGEIPSIFFTMLAMWSLMRYIKNNKCYHLVFMVIELLLGILFRKSTLIVVIAFAISGVLYFLKNKDWKLLIAVIAMAFLPSLMYEGIYRIYEVRSGYEHLDGMPSSALVSMGMRDAYDGKCGWDTDYSLKLLEEHEYDMNAVDRVATQHIEERLSYFANNPSEAFAFYKSKVLSQWNQPLYQAMFFTTRYPAHLMPTDDSLTYKLFNEYFGIILGIANGIQTIVYFGVLCYYLLCVRKEDNILKHILIIAIIGGFIFSIIWEAKARYIFPYYIFMFPYAVLGLKECLLFIKRHIIIRNVSKTDNRGCNNAGEESPGFIGQDAR